MLLEPLAFAHFPSPVLYKFHLATVQQVFPTYSIYLIVAYPVDNAIHPNWGLVDNSRWPLPLQLANQNTRTVSGGVCWKANVAPDNLLLLQFSNFDCPVETAVIRKFSNRNQCHKVHKLNIKNFVQVATVRRVSFYRENWQTKSNKHTVFVHSFLI